MKYELTIYYKDIWTQHVVVLTCVFTDIINSLLNQFFLRTLEYLILEEIFSGNMELKVTLLVLYLIQGVVKVGLQFYGKWYNN